jgi:hypothetical protein
MISLSHASFLRETPKALPPDWLCPISRLNPSLREHWNSMQLGEPIPAMRGFASSNSDNSSPNRTARRLGQPSSVMPPNRSLARPYSRIMSLNQPVRVAILRTAVRLRLTQFSQCNKGRPIWDPRAYMGVLCQWVHTV